LEQTTLFRAVVDICILIILAELTSTISVKLNLPRILGPLFAGIIFGPYMIGGIRIGDSPLIEMSDLILVFS